jgi:hypothetical protein
VWTLTLPLASAIAFANPTTGSVHGTVVDPAGKPVAGAKISYLQEYEILESALIAETETDENGAFELNDVPEAKSNLGEIVAQKEGFARAIKLASVIAGEVRTIQFQLQPGDAWAIVPDLESVTVSVHLFTGSNKPELKTTGLWAYDMNAQLSVPVQTEGSFRIKNGRTYTCYEDLSNPQATPWERTSCVFKDFSITEGNRKGEDAPSGVPNGPSIDGYAVLFRAEYDNSYRVSYYGPASVEMYEKMFAIPFPEMGGFLYTKEGVNYTCGKWPRGTEGDSPTPDYRCDDAINKSATGE